MDVFSKYVNGQRGPQLFLDTNGFLYIRRKDRDTPEENFVVFGGVTDDGSRMIVFSTPRNLKVLGDNPNWIADGTFMSALGYSNRVTPSTLSLIRSASLWCSLYCLARRTYINIFLLNKMTTNDCWEILLIKCASTVQTGQSKFLIGNKNEI